MINYQCDLHNFTYLSCIFFICKYEASYQLISAVTINSNSCYEIYEIIKSKKIPTPAFLVHAF